jgi:hypothetical protein
MFSMDEDYKPNLVVELLVAHSFNGVERFVSNVFLFLVCFVALQVMMKGAW